MLEPGAQIDIWVVERALGAGGMGSVYRCHNRTANRILAAVKVLETTLRLYPEAEARFIREAEILFQLDHPNIVKVRNVRTDMSPPYLEMEFVAGESLEELLRAGALPFDQALDLMHQIASAVAYLHDKGVRHRDIKPANLLVKTDGRVKLVDFGLAMEADHSRITEQGVTFGTVSYAPPEWIAPDTLDPARWDIYAIGVVFYEMLTGGTAFPVSGQGSARQQAMQVIVGKQSHPPLDPGESFHDDVRELVRAMTWSDPKRRIGSASEVYERVKALKETMRRPGVTLMPDTGTFADDDESHSVVVEAPHPRMVERATSPPTWPATGASPAGVDHIARGPTPPPAILRTVEAKRVPNRPARSRAPVIAGAAVVGLGILVVTALAALIVASLLVPGARRVDVVVTGLPGDAEVGVRLNDLEATGRDGPVFTFARVEPGTMGLVWSIGARCPIASCPGAGCPEWCAVGTHAIEIPKGRALHTLTLPLEPPEGRRVRVRTPQLPDEATADFRLGAHRGRRAEGGVLFDDVLPGPYALVARVGTCPDEALGCWPDGECPEGCRSSMGKLVVPWGADEFSHTLAVPAPALAKQVAAVRRPEVDVARPAPPGGGVVTTAAFASWLNRRPDWKRDAAIAAGRADADYLKDWSAGQPGGGEGGRAVVNVSWHAAAAYCSDRGGLADVGAEPLEWAEADSGLWIEWRVLEGRAAWRSNDGRTHNRSVDPKTSSPLTGFRCAR